MAEITAAMVKNLREKTGAGMMDCKKALTETDGNPEAAEDWLRKKGLSAAAKKAGRVAAEGLVGVVTEDRAGAVVEVNSETDFVARNPKFQEFVIAVAHSAVAQGDDVEALRQRVLPEFGVTTEQHLTHLISTVGENMNLRRARRLEVSQGAVIGYVHNPVKTGIGKIGVLVALESEAELNKLAPLGKQLAMHVAASAPLFLDVASVDSAALERERNILKERAMATGKPEAIVDKMVEGQINKYYADVVLLEQIYAIDGETKITKVLDAASRSAGAEIKITGFVRFMLGEGIEKEATDFAAEVRKAAEG